MLAIIIGHTYMRNKTYSFLDERKISPRVPSQISLKKYVEANICDTPAVRLKRKYIQEICERVSRYCPFVIRYRFILPISFMVISAELQGYREWVTRLSCKIIMWLQINRKQNKHGYTQYPYFMGLTVTAPLVNKILRPRKMATISQTTLSNAFYLMKIS